MKFQVYPESLMAGWPEAQNAYITGYDGRVFPSRVEIDANTFACRRPASDSGKLNIAWPVPGFGRPVLTTSSLREQEGTYLLAVELARGKICQVRNQVAAWDQLGMQIPVTFEPLHKAAHVLFAKAVGLRSDPAAASDIATQAIVKACQAAELLTKAYTEQRLAIRVKKSSQLPIKLGCNLAQATPSAHWDAWMLGTFNTAVVPIQWRHIEKAEGNYDWDLLDAQVEWCLQRKLVISGGPLLDLSPNGLPKWLDQWGHDFFNLQSFLCDFVETAVQRYAGKIRLWEVSSRVNTGGALNLTEENCLTLVARTLEVARRVDEESQYLIRIEQPWGTYQSRGQHRLTPVQFVDALLRCGVGLAGVNLEIAVGYADRGSSSRDLLDFSRMLDVWSSLEVPLHITLAFPSSNQPDPQSKHGIVQEPNGWKSPWSEEAQAEWIDTYLPLLIAKQLVTGIYWTHLSDAAPHDFPNAGLIDAAGRPKKALKALAEHSKVHWQ
ncbi:MAG: endo-1,4-beta-xylanase [Planctomycetaceae bacterium]